LLSARDTTVSDTDDSLARSTSGQARENRSVSKMPSSYWQQEPASTNSSNANSWSYDFYSMQYRDGSSYADRRSDYSYTGGTYDSTNDIKIMLIMFLGWCVVAILMCKCQQMCLFVREQVREKQLHELFATSRQGWDDVVATDAAEKGITECSLCLEEYKDGEEVMTLPCGHIFHVKCVEKWFIARKFRPRSCPKCRKNPIVNEPDEHDSSIDFEVVGTDDALSMAQAEAEYRCCTYLSTCGANNPCWRSLMSFVTGLASSASESATVPISTLPRVITGPSPNREWPAHYGAYSAGAFYMT